MRPSRSPKWSEIRPIETFACLATRRRRSCEGPTSCNSASAASSTCWFEISLGKLLPITRNFNLADELDLTR